MGMLGLNVKGGCSTATLCTNTRFPRLLMRNVSQDHHKGAGISAGNKFGSRCAMLTGNTALILPSIEIKKPCHSTIPQ